MDSTSGTPLQIMNDQLSVGDAHIAYLHGTGSEAALAGAENVLLAALRRAGCPERRLTL